MENQVLMDWVFVELKPGTDQHQIFSGLSAAAAWVRTAESLQQRHQSSDWTLLQKIQVQVSEPLRSKRASCGQTAWFCLRDS